MVGMAGKVGWMCAWKQGTGRHPWSRLARAPGHASLAGPCTHDTTPAHAQAGAPPLRALVGRRGRRACAAGPARQRLLAAGTHQMPAPIEYAARTRGQRLLSPTVCRKQRTSFAASAQRTCTAPVPKSVSTTSRSPCRTRTAGVTARPFLPPVAPARGTRRCSRGSAAPRARRGAQGRDQGGTGNTSASPHANCMRARAPVWARARGLGGSATDARLLRGYAGGGEGRGALPTGRRDGRWPGLCTGHGAPGRRAPRGPRLQRPSGAGPAHLGEAVVEHGDAVRHRLPQRLVLELRQVRLPPRPPPPPPRPPSPPNTHRPTGGTCELRQVSGGPFKRPRALPLAGGGRRARRRLGRRKAPPGAAAPL